MNNKLNPVPLVILEELERNYGVLDFSMDGIIDPDTTQTFKLEYQKFDPIFEPITMMYYDSDAGTYELITVDGTTHHYATSHCVRCNDASIRGVYAGRRVPTRY